MIEISKEDAEKITGVDEELNGMLSKVGMLREEFLVREQEFMHAVTNFRNERKTLVQAIGRSYLKDQPSPEGGWRFDETKMAFITAIEAGEKPNDHNQSS